MSKIQKRNNPRLIIQVVVGYMYKVMKNGKNITLFKKEFAAIRHGNYKEFLNLIGEPISYIMVGNINEPGIVSTNNDIEDNDIDFIRLIKSAESLKKFHKNCKKEYNKIDDLDIPDRIFEQLSLFELSLRMHRNNLQPSRASKITLESIISEMQHLANFTNQETETLHEGRRFLNAVKRPDKLKTSWKVGINKFEHAFKILDEKKIKIL